MIKAFGIVSLVAITVLDPGGVAVSAVPEKTVRKFQEFDRDGNGKLTIDEYVGRREPNDLLRRDFLIFDFDRDRSFSLVEFAPIANGTAGYVRGPIPDPLVKIVDQVASELDRRLKNWDERPDEEVSTVAFLDALRSGLEPSHLDEAMTPILQEQADADRDSQVSRKEARRFLEIQFGLRLPDGQPLRTPNGQVNNYVWFRSSDRNSDGQIEWSEFMTQTGGDEAHQKLFQEADQDGNQIVSLEEWFIAKWTFEDPIEGFRILDLNRDGFVDTAELIQGSPPWKKTGLKYLVAAFDEDQDGQMSLAEYRLSPHANMILGWMQLLIDTDHDQRLSFEEYRFEQPLFPMLREFFFRKFDRNHDGYLDRTEYDFRTERPYAMYVMDADGSGLKKLDTGTNFRFGSPSVSPDGKWIAFDGTSGFNSGIGESVIQVMPISGGNPRPICNGVMPTWSTDALKLACSRSRPQFGIWIVDLGGQDPLFISPGWASQWSPDGKRISFVNDNSIQIYDLDHNQAEIILQTENTVYARFEINATWSPDSQRICLNAKKPSNTEVSDIVLLNIAAKDNERLKVRHSGRSIGADFAWHPNGRKVICTMFCEERMRTQFYEFDADANQGPLTLVAGQPENMNAMDVTWTPDGKQLIFTIAVVE